jgi:hypothetical protein
MQVRQELAAIAFLTELHADQAFWTGDRAAEGRLKDLVTGHRQPIEFKGKESIWVDNYVRLFVTGNQHWIVLAGFEERRFPLLDVGEDHMQDHVIQSDRQRDGQRRP